MAKALFFFGFIATALCFSSLLGSASAHEDPIHIKGTVYCDPCRVEFVTPLTKPIKDAAVKFACRSRVNNSVSFSAETKTDETGSYTIKVDGDHEDEICEATVVNSPDAECNEKFKTIDSARVLVTHNVGVVDPLRYANSLGFKSKEVHPDCAKVLQDMGYLPEFGFF